MRSQMSQQKKQQLKERMQRNNELVKKSIRNEYVFIRQHNSDQSFLLTVLLE